MEGKGNVLNNLRIWRTLTNDADLPYHVLLDGDAVEERDRAIDEALIKEEHITTLRVRTIEETYPVELLEDVLSRIYDISGFTLAPANERPINESVETVLADQRVRNWNHGRWKLTVAHVIADRLEAEPVPDEFMTIADRIKNMTSG